MTLPGEGCILGRIYDNAAWMPERRVEVVFS